MKTHSYLYLALVRVLLPIGAAWSLFAGLEAVYFPPTWQENDSLIGALILHLKLPGTSGGIEEPLMAVGKRGEATFAFIRRLPGARARVGVEFWGRAAFESPDFKVASQDAEVTVEIAVPALFPPAGDRRWRGVSETEQRLLLSQYRIAVNGVTQLHGKFEYAQAIRFPVYVGSNPLGGSAVSDRLTAIILAARRQF